MVVPVVYISYPGVVCIYIVLCFFVGGACISLYGSMYFEVGYICFVGYDWFFRCN